MIQLLAGPAILTETCQSPALDDDSTFQITESVTIEGNSTLLHGANLWISDTGIVNRFDTGGECPRHPYVLGGISFSLFMIGERNTNNSGIEVTIENLVVDNVSQLGNVRDGARLTLRGVTAHGHHGSPILLQSGLRSIRRR